MNGLLSSCAKVRRKIIRTLLRSRVALAVLALLLVCLSQAAVAGSTGTLTGIVKDSSGTAMPGVTVHATSQATGASLSAVTDSTGQYRFESVIPGTWQVSFAGNGFDTVDNTVQLKAESAVFNVTLGTAALAQAGAQRNQQNPPMPNMPNMPNTPTPQAQPSAPHGNVSTEEFAVAPGTELTEEQVSDPKALLAYIKMLEDRVRILESYSVMSVPETRTKRIEVYVDKNGAEYDHPEPGTKKIVTYQRERVYRRAEINQKIAAVLADQADRSVAVGISAAIMPNGALQTSGPKTAAAGHAYDLANADITFAARVAQYTTFFADLVGLSGPTPENEIPTLTLLNSYTARLNRQNEVDVREAWVKTELFRQRLAVVAGRLDLTNYFDRNAAANDETRQFLSDALVNSPVLGLTSDGAGIAAVYDPRKSWSFAFGFQQNAPAARSLSSSIVPLAEVSYTARPLSLPPGHYGVWVRTDNTLGGHKNATGLTLDQGLTDHLMLFARVGFGYIAASSTSLGPAAQNGNMLFYSAGAQMQRRFVFFPGDNWGIGYAQTNLTSGAARENLGEVYYNFQMTERLRLSPRIQYVREGVAGRNPVSYVLPGIRLQAIF